jgi:tetratricopeptide (TPR) repeat protein
MAAEYESQGLKQKAKENLIQAIGLSNKTKNDKLLIAANHKLALLEDDSGHITEADQAYINVIKLLRSPLTKEGGIKVCGNFFVPLEFDYNPLQVRLLQQNLMDVLCETADFKERQNCLVESQQLYKEALGLAFSNNNYDQYQKNRVVENYVKFLADQGRKNEAIAVVHQFEPIYKPDIRDEFEGPLLANLYSIAGDAKTAEEIYIKNLEQKSGNKEETVKNRLDYARFLDDHNRNIEAEKEYKLAIDLARVPDNYAEVYELEYVNDRFADFLLRQKRYGEAENYYRKQALALNRKEHKDTSLLADKNLAECLMGQNRYKEAALLYEGMLNTISTINRSRNYNYENSNYNGANYNNQYTILERYAKCLKKLGDTKKALLTEEKAAQLKNKYPLLIFSSEDN